MVLLHTPGTRNVDRWRRMSSLASFASGLLRDVLAPELSALASDAGNDFLSSAMFFALVFLPLLSEVLQ